MDAEKTADRVPLHDLVRYFLRLGLLGLGGPVALVSQMERELSATRRAHEGRDARGHRGLPVPARAARHPRRHLDFLHPGRLLRSLGRGWAFILPNFIIFAAMVWSSASIRLDKPRPDRHLETIGPRVPPSPTR
jgi:chromate transporter